MRVIKTYILNFQGFSATKGACHIALGYADDKRLYIVCTQIPGYRGTSVTNAFEIIAATVINDILDGKLDQSDCWSEFLLEASLDGYMKQSQTDTTLWRKLCEFVQSQHANKPSWIACLSSPNLVWLERYPVGTGIREGIDSVMRVRMSRAGTPSWDPQITVADLSTHYGDSLHKLIIDGEIIREKWEATKRLG